MYFFDRNEAFRDNVFCIDEKGERYTYEQVWQMGDGLIAPVPSRSLVLLLAVNDARSVSTYLALLRKRCPVILMGGHTDPAIAERMIQTYRPGFVIKGQEVTELTEHQVLREHDAIHPDLGLLLSTSGSTGAQKLVRLSYDNLQANCDSIVAYLELTAQERPVTTLPMEYTYGLSVIHSHAAVGASIILTERTLFEPAFWELVQSQEATSMAGVPYTYEMLHRLRIQRMDLPHLRTLTQAGGHLKRELQESMSAWAQESGRRLFVMYGQTEATARMSYIPWEHCREKIGSIGIPVPGGSIELLDENGAVIREPGISGELIYYGKNVSLGYAVCREDLAKGDENGGRLATGDMAFRDEDGYYFITGRKKRFVKLYGKRISLDQVQEDLQEIFDTPDIVCTGDDRSGIQVWVSRRAVQDAESAEAAEIAEVAEGAEGAEAVQISEAAFEEMIRQEFFDRWGIRDSMVHIRPIDAIPRNPSGKTIYAALTADSQ